MIQSRLVWPLCKDDTQILEVLHFFKKKLNWLFSQNFEFTEYIDILHFRGEKWNISVLSLEQCNLLEKCMFSKTKGCPLWICNCWSYFSHRLPIVKYRLCGVHLIHLVPHKKHLQHCFHPRLCLSQSFSKD